MEIAQAAFALLDVGLDDVAAVAHPAVALGPFFELQGDEVAGAAGQHVAAEAGLQGFEQGFVAPHVARFEQSRPYRLVGEGGGDRLVHRARGVADLEAEIPEEVERRLDDLLGPRRRLERRYERQVDVGISRHLAAAIAAHRHQQQPLARSRIGVREQPRRDVIVGEPNDLVGEIGVGRRRLAALPGPLLEARGDLRPARRERRLERLGAVGAGGFPQCVGEAAPVDDLALGRDGGEAGRHQLSPAASRFSR